MDEMDRILGEEPLIAASTSFCARVMQSVRQEAVVPPPLEFPWQRFLPGLFTSVALILGTFMVLGWTDDSSPNPVDPLRLREMLAAPVSVGLLVGALALAGSALLTWLVLRPGDRSSGYW